MHLKCNTEKDQPMTKHLKSKHIESRAPIWRAPFRLLSLFGITLGMSAMYALNALMGRMTTALSISYMQTWSRRLLRWTSIDVAEHGEMKGKGAILIANHRSYADIPAIMGSVPCTFLAKAQVKSWPVIGWAASVANTIFVDRDCKNSRREARKELKKRLDEGMSVMVFAEGTTTNKGEMNALRPGMFYTAAENDLPIVPVAIEYLEPEDAWTGDESFIAHFLQRFRQKRMKVVVTYGPPLRGKDPVALKQQTEDWIRNELKKDIDQLHTQGVNPLAKEFYHEQQAAKVQS
ncbi:MAG: 1-acyl-sn-glycerol-3-phosphate acyltransferase [Deltaproteobacteria bacterium]|nr:MAG: 1-acyl-sn-glycerol-3-phosphate acyltransferase [Deltaproteobacteria bacterium]